MHSALHRDVITRTRFGRDLSHMWPHSLSSANTIEGRPNQLMSSYWTYYYHFTTPDNFIKPIEMNSEYVKHRGDLVCL